MDTLDTMLSCRGWVVADIPQSPALPAGRSDLYGVYTTAPHDPHPVALVLNFDNPHRTSNIAVKEVRHWYAWMEEAGIRHLLIVSREKLNTYIVRELSNLEGVTVNMLTTAELRVNPTHSAYYVPHTRLPPADAAAAKAKYGALPLLPTTDPVAKFFGWNEGDVIRVRRDYGGFEFTDVYREVTKL